MKSESTNLWPPTASDAPPGPASEETLDLGRVFSALGRRALLIAAITLAVGAVAGARAKLSPPSYLANFEILIQPSTGEAQVAVNLTGLSPQRNDSLLTLEDQVKILTSPGVLQPVVDQAQAEDLGGCASVGLSLPMDASERCYQALRQSLTIQLTEVKNNAPASRIFSAQIEGQSPQEVQRMADLVAQRFLDYGLESRQRDIQQGIDFLDSKLPDVRAQVDRLQIQLEQLRQTNNIITPEARGSQLTRQIDTFEAEYLKVLVELDGILKLYEGLQQQLTQQPSDQDDVLHSSSDLKRITPVPILGLIPHPEGVERGSDESPLLTLYRPTTAGSNGSSRTALDPGLVPFDGLHGFKESFRSLVANLQRSASEQPVRSLVISAADEVADATTAAYLAWAAAEMGNRVLLIDADFRFPHLHNCLERPNENGFSNVLAGELDLEQAIMRSPLEPNLFVLTAGSATSDPVRLLSAHKIQPFIAKAEGCFDLVIYDAPPLVEYADASLIAAAASGLALVSHLGTVQSAQLEQALEKIWISKIPLLGLIAKEPAAKRALLPMG